MECLKSCGIILLILVCNEKAFDSEVWELVAISTSSSDFIYLSFDLFYVSPASCGPSCGTCAAPLVRPNILTYRISIVLVRLRRFYLRKIYLRRMYLQRI